MTHPTITSASMDRHTGALLTNWEQTVSNITDLLTTAHFERVIRAYVGSHARRLFGELINPANAQRFRWAVALTILLFEPRFVPTRIDLVTFDRTGDSDWIVEGDERPRAHLGDLTVSGKRRLTMSVGRGGILVEG